MGILNNLKCQQILVSGFMNVSLVRHYSNRLKVIAVFFVLMARCLVHQFKKAAHVRDVGVEMSDNQVLEKPYLRWITLFIASGTLLCCALPILLVTLGFGAMVASLNYNIPGLIFLAENKVWTLTISAMLLMLLAWVVWRPNQHCPTDSKLAEICQKSKLWNKRIFWISSVIWIIGFFTSYLLLPLRNLLEL